MAFIAGGYVLYLRDALRFNYPDDGRFPVRGIDVSHHQGAIDWPAVRAAGVAFVFIKSSEGADYRDPAFPRNWEGALSVGIPRGAYHFFTFCAPGASQAENLVAAVAGSPGELPPVADVEFSGNCQQRPPIPEIRAELRLFLDRVQTSLGRRPILYITSGAHARILGSDFPAHQLWPRSIFFEPAKAHFGHWLFWQFAENGRLPGIETLVDLNVFHGSRPEFDSLLAGGAPGA